MKKEKYIVSTTKNGKEYLTVKFHYKVNGSDKQYTKSFPVSSYSTRAECMKAACNHRDLKRAELLTVGLPSGTKRTVEQCFEDYIRMYHETKANEAHLRKYFKYIERFKDTPVDEITSLDIQNHLYSLRFDCSDNVISRIKTVWKDIFKVAQKMGLITLNPLDTVDTPRSKKVITPRSQTVNDADIATLVHYLETHGRTERVRYNHKLYAHLILLMKETGMRPAECLALKRENLDFENKEISITASLGSTEKELKTITVTKTRASIRKIPMTSECEAVLLSLLDMSANDYIFLDYDGNFINSSKVSIDLHLISSRLGIEFHLYALRHRFSTNLVTNGVDVRTAMELMGHSSASMTVMYARSSVEKKRKAIEYVDTNSEKLVENGSQESSK